MGARPLSSPRGRLRPPALLPLSSLLEDDSFLTPFSFFSFFRSFFIFFFSFFATFFSFFWSFLAFLSIFSLSLAAISGLANISCLAACSCRRIWNRGSSLSFLRVSSVVFVALFRKREPAVFSPSFLTSSKSLSLSAATAIFMSSSSVFVVRALCSYIQSSLSTLGLSMIPAAA